MAMFCMVAVIMRSAASTVKETDSDSVMSPAVTSHVISCLDLLSANYDGLAARAAPYAAKVHLLKHLHATLVVQSLDERVRFEITMICLTTTTTNTLCIDY